MIDAHCHIHLEDFEKDLRAVIERAKASGVKAVITSGMSVSDSLKALEVAKTYRPFVFATIGLAPYENLEELEEMLNLIKKHASEIVGIGEIGLDWKYSKKEEQIPVFEAQLAVAEELKLPVVIHSRSAGKYVIEILQSYSLKVVLHSFDGSLKYAKRAFEEGYFFTIPPTVAVSRQKQLLAKALPLDLLLLETDSPAQWPFGGRNEPKNLEFVAEKVAEIKGIDVEEVRKASEDNAKRVFNLVL